MKQFVVLSVAEKLLEIWHEIVAQHLTPLGTWSSLFSVLLKNINTLYYDAEEINVACEKQAVHLLKEHTQNNVTFRINFAPDETLPLSQSNGDLTSSKRFVHSWDSFCFYYKTFK